MKLEGHRRGGGGGGLVRTARSHQVFLENPCPYRGPPDPPWIQGSGGGGGFVSADSGDSPGSDGGGGGFRPGRTWGIEVRLHPRSPCRTLRPVLSSRDAVVRGGTRGSGRTHARCSKRGGGPLEWWAIPCVYRGRTARAPLALRPSAEGGRAHAGRGGVVGGGGVARARAEVGVPAKRAIAQHAL